MPLLRIETTATVPDGKRAALLASLSKLVAETIGKPESYVMVSISPAAMVMAGSPGDVAFADIRSIGGLNASVNQKLSQRICGLLDETLGVPEDRVYLNFTDVPASDWGWNSETFG